LMFSEYRMRAFQGAFHSNPDYAFWYGWSALKQALTEIQEMDAQLRKMEKS
jgi:hydroxylamine dehydrogenase